MGMGTSVSTAVSERTAVIIEDYMFDASTAGELQPEASPSDFHDAWDLDGTDFTPEASPDDEGYWQDGSNLVTNGTYDELGSELVTNGDFSTAGTLTSSSYSLGWTSPDSGLSISSGVLNIVRTSSGGRAYASNGSSGNLTITSGKTYQLTYTITENSDNSTLQYHNGGVYINTSSSVAGTYTVTYVAAGTIFLLRNGGSNDTTIKIDNVTLKQVDPNNRWTLSNTTIEDGVLNFVDNTSAAQFAVHTNTSMMDIGSSYEITLNVNRTSGSFRVLSGTGASTLTPAVSINSSGLQTFIVTNDTNGGKLYLYTDTGENFIGTIDDVSVREYAITPLDV